MQHTKPDQKWLDSMTQEEKFRRTARESFEERGTLLVNGKGVYLTKSEMPYKGTKEHFILWLKEDTKEAKVVFDSIALQAKKLGYKTKQNEPDKMSVKQRQHRHIYK